MPERLNLLQGTLDVLVLRALEDEAKHGYAIARFIKAGSRGAFQILDGALYTSLHRLEERGWVRSMWGNSERGKRAKFYRLTAKGRRALKAETATWQEYVAAVSGVLSGGAADAGR